MLNKLSIVLFVLFCAPTVFAQEQPVTPSDVRLSTEMIKLAMSAERKQIFQEGMVGILKAESVETFWNIFDTYLKERSDVDEKNVKMITRYANDFSKMPDKEINQIINEESKIQAEQAALRNKYFKLISKKVNLTVAARFYQIDNYISSVSRVALMDQVPFIGDDIVIQ